MRTIERAKAFRRDYKRAMKSPRHRDDLRELLVAALELLAADRPMPASNRDHALTGNWVGYRDCHIKPDLLLIYAKPDTTTLRLARLESHSELFG
jgi:mRNA interferase YafQ